MDLHAILFDVNGTLVDIETDEALPPIYRAISRFLIYQGLDLPPRDIQEQYFAIMSEQRAGSVEAHPEFDAVAIWRVLLDRRSGPATRALPGDHRAGLPLFLAQLHRALARKRLRPYPQVRRVLDCLRDRYALGIVSDAQTAYALPELQELGLREYFRTVIVSGDYGYRKPDSRLFGHALAALGARPDQAIYVGNDMYCDIFGAQQAGLKAVFWPTEYGRKEHAGTKPDYRIDHFPQLLNALAYFESH